jgi:putative hemolysin
MKIISENDIGALSPLFRGERGIKHAKLLMRLFAIDRVNLAYERSSGCKGPCFASNLLNELGIRYVVGNAERLGAIADGAFITVSNHPYGGLDGIILIDLFGSLRPDYKFMVNQILSLVKALSGNFISVTPVGNTKKGVSGTSIHGIRETISHLSNNHPVGFFPSGAVSDFSLKDMTIRDRKWQDSLLRLIYSAKVPILPVRFFDRNSSFFYFLGLIDWRIRNLRLPYELFNKTGSELRIGIGNLISVEQQASLGDFSKFGAFLRKSIYEMPLPGHFTPRNQISMPAENKDLPERYLLSGA